MLMKPNSYCIDEKQRKWVNGPDINCGGDWEHCKRVVMFGNQSYCGYTPGRCGLWQVVRTQAGCLWCKHSKKNLDSAKCLPCLSAETRINFEDERGE